MQRPRAHPVISLALPYPPASCSIASLLSSKAKDETQVYEQELKENYTKIGNKPCITGCLIQYLGKNTKSRARSIQQNFIAFKWFAILQFQKKDNSL